MMKNKILTEVFGCIVLGAVFAVLGCCFLFVKNAAPGFLFPMFMGGLVVFDFILNAVPILFTLKLPGFRLKACYQGVICLKSFIWALVFSVIIHIILGIYLLPDDWWELVCSGIVCAGMLSVLFWNGMLSVYCVSVQLGVKSRIRGLLLGLVPIANIVMLFKIIRIVREEVFFERDKAELDKMRSDEKICETRYPILFVHGVFFRDFKHINYWGRIPDAIIKNGGKIYYGNHQSAASVVSGGQELAERIRQIIKESGCEKVNIIAHSKGGLDSRYAIAKCGIADMVASLTTINTPHRGCLFAEYLLEKLPRNLQLSTAAGYNAAMRRLGDADPDFLAAVSDLKADVCAVYDKELIVPESVFTQSVGSLLKHASGGKFPLNFSYHLVKYFDGPNDGLVSEPAFSFGESYTLLKPTGNRGISHGDMIDLNRENIRGFDVREFYVQLVGDLKKKGF